MIWLRRPLTWPSALLLGSVLGLSLRLLLFLITTFVVQAVAHVAGVLLPLLPAVDPVYGHAAVSSLGDVQVQGLAIGGPLGTELHALQPAFVVDPARTHFALLRLAVRPGSALNARLAAAGLAHAALLGIGLWIVRSAWSTRSVSRMLVGMAVQVQVAVGILGAPPSIRELEATGLAFAANALAPWLWQRGHALTDGLSAVPPPLLAAMLVGLALVVAYLPASLLVLLKVRARALTLGSALAVVLTSAACAGALEPDVGARVAAAPELPTQSAGLLSADFVAARALAPRPILALPSAFTSDRWFDTPTSTSTHSPSRVEVQGGNGQYRYLVNGQPQIIKGMGLNTQYSHLMSPAERAARLDADMAAYQQLGAMACRSTAAR